MKVKSCFCVYVLSSAIILGVTSGVMSAAELNKLHARAKATFAGGCFWCMEYPFDVLEGVISTTSGYAGGHQKNPTYNEVSAGTTGHAEAVEVEYDPEKISYPELLEI